MAGPLHETSITWMRRVYFCWGYDGLLTLEGSEQMTDSLICMSLGSTLWNSLVYTNDLIVHKNFIGEFAGSGKTADLTYTPIINGIRREFPTVVLESGWSESGAPLFRDAQVWLKGSAGAVKVVLLFKLFPENIRNEIKAKLYVCRLLAGELDITRYACSSLPCYYLSYILLTDPLTLQKIFPGSASPVADPHITVEELFDGRPPEDMQGRTKLPLSLEKLRRAAREEILQQGHIPMPG